MDGNITDLAAARAAAAGKQIARAPAKPPPEPDANLVALVEQLGALLEQVAANLAAAEKRITHQDEQIVALTTGFRMLISTFLPDGATDAPD